MPLKDIIITSSINSIVTQSYGQRTYIASTDDQSFPIEEITGSYAGAWPNFISGANYTVGLVVNVTQSWPDSNITPLGLVSFTHDTMEEFVNGEFSGSEYVVTDGNLTDEDCQQLLEVSPITVDYSFFPYGTTLIDGVVYDTLLPAFLNPYTVPRNGEILFHYNRDFISSPSSTASRIDYVKISRIDQNGNDNTPSLQSLGKLIWDDTSAGKITLDIINISANQTYFYYQVTSNTLINIPFFENDNVLDYTLEATSSYSSSLNFGYNYLTSSWTSSIDIANGFNTSSGQYIFPLTPNCEIQFTASANISLQASCSFSLAITAYNPINNNIVGGISTLSEFGSGSYTIILTSSLYDPIQTYKYQLEALLELPPGIGDIVTNATLSYDSGSTWDAQDKPGDGFDGSWESIRTSTPTITASINEYALTKNYNSPFNLVTDTTWPYGYRGVIYNREANVSPSILRATFQKAKYGGKPINFQISKSYIIEIEIPNYTTSSAGDIYNFGPPSADITCSLRTDDFSNQYHVGYILSGSSGTIQFPFFTTGSFEDVDNICITAPPEASVFDLANTFNYFAITSINVITEAAGSGSISDLSFNITQSQSPETSTSSILVLEPYLTSDFTYNDCNVLLNNYSQNEISGKVRRVLYDNGGLIPSNIEQIIDNTAEFAEVNDYLYNANANILPRYIGVRTTSPNFNLPAVNGFNSTELASVNPNSPTFTNTSDPNVEQTTTYFAYFNEYKSNNPILKNTTSPVIKYLIREDGETFSPSVDDITYYNLVGSFPVGTKTYSNLLNNTSPIFNSSQSILMSGESYTPILSNIDDSNVEVATFTGSISFENLQAVTNASSTQTYTFKVQNNNVGINPVPLPIPSDGSQVNLFATGFSTQLNFVVTGGFWGPTPPPFPLNFTLPSWSFGGVPDVEVNVDVDGIFFRAGVGANPGVSVVLVIELWRRNGATTTKLDEYISQPRTGNAYTVLPPIIAGTNRLIKKRFIPTVGDTIYATAKVIATGPCTPALNSFAMRIGTLGIPVPSVSTPFWTTGSSNSTTLTSSITLGPIIEAGNYRQTNIPTSGFDPFELPCEIKIGDEIRFGYDEDNTYRIIDTYASQSGVNNDIQTILVVDKPIPSIPSININNFTIRRKIRDAITGIALDATLFSPISDGYLLPEYPSRTIKSNISNITQDLINKSII